MKTVQTGAADAARVHTGWDRVGYAAGDITAATVIGIAGQVKDLIDRSVAVVVLSITEFDAVIGDGARILTAILARAI